MCARRRVQTQILALTHTYLVQSRAIPQPKTALYFPINVYAQKLLRKFIIQNFYETAFSLWIEEGISSELWVQNMYNSSAKYIQSHSQMFFYKC